MVAPQAKPCPRASEPCLLLDDVGLVPFLVGLEQVDNAFDEGDQAAGTAREVRANLQDPRRGLAKHKLVNSQPVDERNECDDGTRDAVGAFCFSHTLPFTVEKQTGMEGQAEKIRPCRTKFKRKSACF